MTNEIKILGLTLNINPVAFTIPIGEGWDVYWYGIIIATGFLLAFLYGMKKAPRLGLKTDNIIDGVIITAPLAIFGARAYYIIFDKNTTFADFFKIHEGGLAIYGGVIMAVVGAAITCKWKKMNFLSTLDLIAPCLLIGQAIGRWGNFFNQEAFGTNTSLPWGMTSDEIVREIERYNAGILTGGSGELMDPLKPVHPCFLYESLWCIAGFFLIAFLMKRRKFSGQLILTYGIWYGLGRSFIEGLRTDSLPLGSLRVSQWLSILAVAACSAIMISKLAKIKRLRSEGEYIPQFEIDNKNELDSKIPVAEESGEEAAAKAVEEAVAESAEKSAEDGQNKAEGTALPSDGDETEN